MSAVTKGIFVSTASRRMKEKLQTPNNFTDLLKQSWYHHYDTMWNSLRQKLEELNKQISMELVDDIVCYMKNYKSIASSIPAVTLYTGTNLSDHGNLFNTISTRIQEELSYRVVLLHPSQEISVKYLLGCMIYSFIYGKQTQFTLEELQLEDESMKSKLPTKKLAYSMFHLEEWYNESFIRRSKETSRPHLVIIIPDIEAFSASILRQFLKSLSAFKNRLPLMVIFGVATSFQIIPEKLSHEVLSNFTLRTFQSQSPVVFLNNVLEKVFFNSNCPFQLGNDVLDFLTTSFLYYNFSVEMFIRGIKFCLMNHFFNSNINVLCCHSEKISEIVNSLKKPQLVEISKLPTVLKYKRKNSIEEKNLLDCKVVEKLLNELHEHLSAFHVAVRCLHMISDSLPQSPLGTHIREIYSMSVSSDITKTEEFKKCFDMLQYLSKNTILEKIDVLISLLSSNSSIKQFVDVLPKLRKFYDNIEKSDMQMTVEIPSSSPPANNKAAVKRKVDAMTPNSRAEFKKTLQNRVQAKGLTEFEKTKRDFLSFLSADFFKHFLRPSSEFPLSEILVYNQVDVLRNGFDGKPRAVLHKTMCDPNYFLQCNCCKINDPNTILETFPDLCVAYKLHLECGKEVNLYDWLQSFRSIVDKCANSMECNSVDPRIHARFLQAVKDLQFLGFIEPSKRKVDHVVKLKF